MLLVETDKAYIAGIVDGEGSICITKRLHPSPRSQSPVYTASLQISMVDKEAIEFIAARYKGRVYQFKGRTDPIHRPYYRFDCTSLELMEILKDLAPYMKVKSVQANVALEFLGTVGLRGRPRVTVPDEILDKRAFLCSEIKRLNQRMD